METVARIKNTTGVRPLSPPHAVVSPNKSYSILVVEDSPSELLRICSLLEKRGYEVVTAKNGKEAQGILSSKQVDVIVSDWQMPEMDGIALCQWVKETLDISPYFLILTGRSNKYELISALDAGADDYITKPANAEELAVRIKAGLRINALAVKLAENNTRLQLSLKREKHLNKELQNSLKAAARLQSAALPDPFSQVKTILSAHCFRPAQGVAGDGYSVFELDKEHVAFYQIDVAGHGVRAAMMSYSIARYLSEAAREYAATGTGLSMLSPKAVTQRLNEVFCCNDDTEDYFTLVYGVINCNSGEGVMTQAGHPPPYLVVQGKEVKELGCGGYAVGMFAAVDYEEYKFTLPETGRLVIYTDGIFECATPSGVQVSDSVLKQIVQSLHNVSINKLQQHLSTVIDRLIGSSPIKDDVSFFVLERGK